MLFYLKFLGVVILVVVVLNIEAETRRFGKVKTHFLAILFESGNIKTALNANNFILKLFRNRYQAQLTMFTKVQFLATMYDSSFCSMNILDKLVLPYCLK